MKTTRSKRWDGTINTLSVDYLNDVVGQMVAYGDRVQFGLTGTGQRPYYQVINSSDKKMAFNSTNHLMHPIGEEFDGSNGSMVYTLDQIKNAMAGVGTRATAVTATRSRSVGGTRAPTVKIQDIIDSQKYDYFKAHRDLLPPTIGEYSIEITDLMKLGQSAEEAFDAVIKLHF
ncbi:hypothetical protein QN379_10445 [Glaciimonas sp. Gout2]|uniref:hypothetical protein n=1 Tax=unclassified Glaciimonas TaxID=2644401 RepID=UPI002B238D00|nr:MULTISPECIES: hypothetical protein [unclassified Glaciimonas]MEB0012250.1 hypothetical protein [Glaciimonas sp. Cout2]MEB0082433.1 hypothetical protein [Glaciimonas sp. Gout2]